MSGLVAALVSNLTAQSRLDLPQIHLGHVPRIGEALAPQRLPKKQTVQCLVAASQLDPCATAIIGGVSYTVAYRAAEGGKAIVTRVSTLDPKFKSPEGLRVGDSVILNGPWDVFEAPYFEVYAKISSLWIPVIGIMGRVDLQVDEKTGKLSGVEVKDLWPSGPTPQKFAINGFIEAEPPASPRS